MEGHYTAPQMEQFYDRKLFGNLWLKYKNNQVNDTHLHHIFDLLQRSTTTMEFLRMHKEMDDLKK
jgi:hypothetical protein